MSPLLVSRLSGPFLATISSNVAPWCLISGLLLRVDIVTKNSSNVSPLSFPFQLAAFCLVQFPLCVAQTNILNKRIQQIQQLPTRAREFRPRFWKVHLVEGDLIHRMRPIWWKRYFIWAVYTGCLYTLPRKAHGCSVWVKYCLQPRQVTFGSFGGMAFRVESFRCLTKICPRGYQMVHQVQLCQSARRW